MSDILLNAVAGALAGAASALAVLRFRGKPPSVGDHAPAPPAVEAAVEASPPVMQEQSAAGETIAAAIARINQSLGPVAEDISHPRELVDLPSFQEALAQLQRPDATLEILQNYALGDNWPLACVAFQALCERPERQTAREAVIRDLPHTRPYVMPYALRFLTTLDPRPATGLTVLAAPFWWQQNPVMPSFFEAYFDRSAELGDVAGFGDGLGPGAEINAEQVEAFLQKIHHPHAVQLLAMLRHWHSTRIDKKFLSGVGVVWAEEPEDRLLVTPPAWREHLSVAETAIRSAKPRSVLVSGKPRIGKSAFLRLLTMRLHAEGWNVFVATGNELMADQMYIGQLEGRVRQLVAAVHSRRKIAWFAGDLWQLASSGTHQGQAASILDQIMPAVVAGDLVLIGECSQTTAARLFQSRPSLRSVIETIPLEAMTAGETETLALDLGQRIAAATGVAVSAQSITATMELAEHYLGSGQLPGAVLELLKRSAAHAVHSDEAEVTAQSVITTLAQISGLPQVILDTSQKVDLSAVAQFFSSRVIGQDEAVKAVIDRIAMLKAGLTDPTRPIGVFLFAGPTGTGKTELAKTLASYLFGSSDRMIRLDMSEFQTAESTSKILGQRGEAGADALIDRVRKQPFSVILLDEFEKAHPNCWDLFLQIFDDGRLSDAAGREADFRHCFIILTSNLGATAHRGAGIGFRVEPGAYAEEQVLTTVGQTFRPEFVNRLDKIIVFRPLSRELMRGILHKELALVQERRGLRERSWAVEWEASAIEFLLDRGFTPEMGARPLKRAIDQHLLAPLAATLVEHRFPRGDQFLFVRSNGTAIEVEFVDPDADPAEAALPEDKPDETLSLPGILLHPTGSPAERAFLEAAWRDILATLDGSEWTSRSEELRVALADPRIWSRNDRFTVFTGLELIDRIKEAARTAERLDQRFRAATDRTSRSSRELAQRLALQLHNLRQGLDDVAAHSPIDALLRVTPALDAAACSHPAEAWCRRVSAMYRDWADKRRMRWRELAPASGKTGAILHITGFGAFRTLAQESGLHVLEDAATEPPQRLVARVGVVAGPVSELPSAGEYAAAGALLDAGPHDAAIVRRYRDGPAPLVRDARGWRSGRLDKVLTGDFDLLAAGQLPSDRQDRA